MKSGYGNFRTPERHELAHRASFRIFVGPLIDGMDVMHSCDNPSCVNPEHLSLGSRSDNMRDAKNKGRTARGVGHGCAKLTPAQVEFARISTLSQRDIAEKLGISQGHISAIRAGKRWAHLENNHR